MTWNSVCTERNEEHKKKINTWAKVNKVIIV